jgi:hypothetical protein
MGQLVYRYPKRAAAQQAMREQQQREEVQRR